MNKMYDALEYCLQALENGADLDAALAHYPDLADELRPMLEAAIAAQDMTATQPSTDAMGRGRAKLMQHAAQMRKAKAPAPHRVIPALQRLSLALMIAAVLLSSGTGLVRASSTSLPGESLYPVKRTWEGMRLFFVFNTMKREVLQSEYENERLEEVGELLTEGRHASIQFAGVFTVVNGITYVSGIPVLILDTTQLPAEGLKNGAAVILTGHTNAQGFVEADLVQILPAGSMVPLGVPLEIEEGENTHSSGSSLEGGSGQTSGNETGGSDEQPNSSADSEPRNFQMEGTVESMSNNILVVNGATVYLEQPEINGVITVGADVKVEGYYAPDGRFIVTKIEVKDSESNGNDGEDSLSSDSSENKDHKDSGNDGSSHDSGGGSDGSENSGSYGGDP